MIGNNSIGSTSIGDGLNTVEVKVVTVSETTTLTDSVTKYMEKTIIEAKITVTDTITSAKTFWAKVGKITKQIFTRVNDRRV